MTDEPAISQPANPFVRILAHGVDMLALTPLFFLVEFAFERGDALKTIIEICIVIAYSVALYGSPWQATLGKRAFGLRVVGKQGEAITYTKAFLRVLVMLFPLMPVVGVALYLMVVGIPAAEKMLDTPEKVAIFQHFLNTCLLFSLLLVTIWYIPMLFTRERKGVHDIVCRTRVITRKT